MKFSMSLIVTVSTVLATAVCCVSAKDTIGSQGVRKVKKQRRNRKLAGFASSKVLELDRIQYNDVGTFYERVYDLITLNDDTNFYGGVKSSGTQNTGTTLGQAFSTSASVYEFGTIQKTENDQFAGGFEPDEDSIPAPNENFFLQGQCKSTGAKGTTADPISAHSCLYDLCLGGGGFSCINLYSGTSFDFRPADSVQFLEVPPPFPLFILGGTGRFYLISGSAELVTITGRDSIQTAGDAQEGVIFQQIGLSTTQELPLGP